ncbi:LytR/AlgR family response regulator transcription factor [Chitinophaga sancti]|uniref:LytR/AlgR family response regulator transcription factor n=1 Tax=Chitinophaga sancti TaxID=1004 RepID=UPI003F7A6423
MMTAIAIDNEPPALQVIETYCNKTDLISLEQVFTSTAAALKYLDEHVIDVLFIDIRMPNISGLDFYKSLPRKMVVVFTTTYSEYAIEGFNARAADFLLKPFQYDRFLQAVDKAAMQVAILQQTGIL